MIERSDSAFYSRMLPRSFLMFLTTIIFTAAMEASAADRTPKSPNEFIRRFEALYSGIGYPSGDMHLLTCSPGSACLGKDEIATLIRMSESSMWQLQKWACRRLGEIKEKSAATAVIKCLSSSSGEVREAAAWALGEIADPAAGEALIRSVQSDGDENDIAARSLGKLHYTAAVPVLITALNRKSYDLRIEAAKTLGILGDSSAIEPLRISMNAPAPEEKFHTATICALARLHSPDGVRAAINVMLTNKSYNLRQDAAKALGDSLERDAIEPLAKALNDESRAVGIEAALSLDRFSDKRGAEYLIRDLKEYGRSSHHEITRISPRTSVPLLVEELRGKHSDIARTVLIQIGAPAADAVYQLYKMDDSGKRNALCVLSELHDGRIADDLIEKIVHPVNEMDQLDAACRLGIIGAPATPKLAEALRRYQNNFLPFFHLLLSCMHSDDNELIPILSSFSTVENSEARMAIAMGLVKKDKVKAGPILRQLLKDKDACVRSASARTLERLESDSIEDLSALQEAQAKETESPAKITIESAIESILQNIQRTSRNPAELDEEPHSADEHIIAGKKVDKLDARSLDKKLSLLYDRNRKEEQLPTPTLILKETVYPGFNRLGYEKHVWDTPDYTLSRVKYLRPSIDSMRFEEWYRAGDNLVYENSDAVWIYDAAGKQIFTQTPACVWAVGHNGFVAIRNMGKHCGFNLGRPPILTLLDAKANVVMKTTIDEKSPVSVSADGSHILLWKKRGPGPSYHGPVIYGIIDGEVQKEDLGLRIAKYHLCPVEGGAIVQLQGSGEILGISGNGTIRYRYGGGWNIAKVGDNGCVLLKKDGDSFRFRALDPSGNVIIQRRGNMGFYSTYFFAQGRGLAFLHSDPTGNSVISAYTTPSVDAYCVVPSGFLCEGSGLEGTTLISYHSRNRILALCDISTGKMLRHVVLRHEMDYDKGVRETKMTGNQIRIVISQPNRDQIYYATLVTYTIDLKDKVKQ